MKRHFLLWFSFICCLACIVVTPIMFWHGDIALGLGSILVCVPLTLMTWKLLSNGSSEASRLRHVLNEEAVILRHDARSVRLHALAIFSIGLGGAVLVFSDLRDEMDALTSIIMPFAVIAVFVWAFMYAKKASGDGVALRVDEEGISFSPNAHPTIRWNQLDRVGMFATGGVGSISFYTRRDQGVLQGTNAVSDLNRRINRMFGYPDFLVSPLGLEVSMREVMEAVERLRQRYT